jgi:hypothetical protein
MASTRRDFLKSAGGAAAVASLPGLMGCRDEGVRGEKLTAEEQYAITAALFMREVDRIARQAKDKSSRQEDLRQLCSRKFLPLFERIHDMLPPGKIDRIQPVASYLLDHNIRPWPLETLSQDGFFIDRFTPNELRLITPKGRGVTSKASNGMLLRPDGIVGTIMSHAGYWDPDAQRTGSRILFQEGERSDQVRIKLGELEPRELLDVRAGLFMHEVNKAPTRQELGVLIDKFGPIFEEIEKRLPQEGRVPNDGGKIILPGSESSPNPIIAEGGFFIESFSRWDFQLIAPSNGRGLDPNDKGIGLYLPTFKRERGEWISLKAGLDLMKEMLPLYNQKAQQEKSGIIPSKQ